MYAINLHDFRLRCLARNLPDAFGDRGGIVDYAVGHEPRPLSIVVADFLRPLECALLRAPEGAVRDLQTGHQGRPWSVYGSARSARYTRPTPLCRHTGVDHWMVTRSWLLVTAKLYPGLLPQGRGFFCSAAIVRYAGSSLEWSGCRADRFRSRSEVCSGPQSSSGPQSFRRPVGSARSWRRFLCTARACPDNAPAGRSYFSSDFGKCQRSRTRPRQAGDLACGRTPGDVSQSLI